MIERLKKYKKYKEIIDFRSWEVKTSIFFTVVMLVSFIFIDFYDNFNFYLGIVTNVLLYMIAGFIGFLGVSITCVAIIISMFDRTISKKIDLVSENKELIPKFLASYEFLAVLIGLVTTMSIIIIFVINSNKTLVFNWFFWIVVALVIYFIIFIIFYTVALISLLIGLYVLKAKIENNMNDSGQLNFDVKNEANELRIDFLLVYFAEKNNLPIETVIKDLMDYINLTDVDESVKKYLKDFYNKE